MGDRNWRGDSGSSSSSSSSSTSSSPVSYRDEKFDGNRGAVTNPSPSFVAWQEYLKTEDEKRRQSVVQWHEERGLIAPAAATETNAPAPSSDSPKI